MEPNDRLHKIERKRVALLDEVAALEPSRLAARPLPGKWSIGEIVEHLVRVEAVVVGDFSRLEDLEDRPRSVKNRVQYLVVMFVLRFGIPVRVPAAAMAPQGGRPLAELREAWDSNHQRLRTFVAGLDRRGTRRTIFRHPVCGPITVAQGLRMLEVHLDTHLRQIHGRLRLLRGAGLLTVE